MPHLTPSASPAHALPIGLSLAAAILWGMADFAGGVAARRMAAFFVVAIAHSVSLIAVLLYLLAAHPPLPTLHTIEFGLLGGLSGGIGLVFFFAALGSGHMGVTTSIAGVLTAAIPVVFSLLIETPPAPLQLAGFLLAAVAIWMIASSPSSTGTSPGRRSLVIAVLSGVAFGAMLVLLRQANGGALWPLAASRVGSAGFSLLISLGAILRRRPHSPTQGMTLLGGILGWNNLGWSTLGLAVASGLLDAGGNFLYTTSALIGRLDVAAVLSSLYPAVTILLAAWLLKERTTRNQAVGMGLALGAVVLISI